jgi:hypothetical protein
MTNVLNRRTNGQANLEQLPRRRKITDRPKPRRVCRIRIKHRSSIQGQRQTYRKACSANRPPALPWSPATLTTASRRSPWQHRLCMPRSQAQRPQADEDSATALEAAVRTKEAWASPAGDRSPVRLSLALQGNVARLWLGIDEHVRPHLSQIISTTINDLNAKGITVDRLVCNGEVITGARIASGHRQPAEPPPHLSHLERGEP